MATTTPGDRSDRSVKKRVLENLAIIHHMFLWLGMPILSVILPIYLLYTRLWWLVLLYVVWFVYDFKTPRSGSRKCDWYRRAAVWRHFADYFPIKLVKTAELSTDRNYIMGCHPHGIFAIAPFTHLCTEGTGFSKTFPGLDPSILTLNGQFWFPIRREIGIAMGGVESSSESLCYLLKNPGYGRLVGIVIGGAEEIFDSVTGVYDLNLRNRKGFCRYALMSGAAIVPSYSFGETDIFKQYHFKRGSFLRWVMTSIKRLCGFAPPLFIGKTMFSFLPFRRPITTVVGAPIIVEKQSRPSQQKVDVLHKRYCDALIELFEKHKCDYGLPADAHLNIL